MSLGGLHRSLTPGPQSPWALAANALLSVLLAPRCAACARLLDRPLGGPICDACWAAVRPITPPVCDACGDALPSWRVVSCGAARCPRCRRTTWAVDRGRTIGAYDGALRHIIHALKYGGRRSVARRLGQLMRDHAGDLLSGVDYAVPVPLHPRRQRARGFNQAAELALTLGLPAYVLLGRVRYTPPQVALPAARRHANVRDAFRLMRERSWGLARSRLPGVSNCCVLLVDDVSTTGATLDACARVLKRAGAREVRALTGARVALRRPS